MGRVNLDDLDKYNSGGSSSKANFFTLKDDGDTEAVHILLEDYNDIQNYTYVTHKIRVGKQKFPSTHVSCLRSYNDPIDKCPFCANYDGKDITGASVRVFIPLWNINAEEIQFFDRPKGYVSKLQKMIHRYGDDFMLHIFDIERNGEKGDQQTTYDFIETDLDEEFELEDEIPEILGSAVIDATADDMEYFLDNGQMPPTGSSNDDEDDEPVRRRSSKGKSKRQEEEDDIPFEEEDEEERPRKRSKDRDTGRKVSVRNSRRRNAEDEF